MSAVRLRSGGQTREIRIDDRTARIDGRPVPFELRHDGGIERLVIDGVANNVVTAREGDRVFVWCDGAAFSFDVVRGARPGGAAEHAGDLLSPMPGRVRRILAPVGSRVMRGDLLLVLEAMKMEHSIRAPRDGVVKRMAVGEGDLVEAGAELAEIE